MRGIPRATFRRFQGAGCVLYIEGNHSSWRAVNEDLEMQNYQGACCHGCLFKLRTEYSGELGPELICP